VTGLLAVLLMFLSRLRNRKQATKVTLPRIIPPVAEKLIFIARLLNVNIAKRLVTMDGKEVHLTTHEYELLETLVKHTGKTRTYQQLLEMVWGNGNKKKLQLLHTTISDLRRKIELDPYNPTYIISEPGIGYLMSSIYGKFDP